MLLRDFKTKMLDVYDEIDNEDYLTCNIIDIHFGYKGHDLYNQILSTYENSDYIYVHRCNQEDGEKIGSLRKNMLLLFEQYVISEKLYKDL